MLAAKVEAFRLSLEGKTKAETDEIAVRYFCAWNDAEIHLKEHENASTEMAIQYQQMKTERDAALKEIDILRKQNQHLTGIQTIQTKDLFGRSTEKAEDVLGQVLNDDIPNGDPLSEESPEETGKKETDDDEKTRRRTRERVKRLLRLLFGGLDQNGQKEQKRRMDLSKLPVQTVFDYNIEELNCKYGEGNWRFAFWSERKTVERVRQTSYVKSVFKPIVSVGLDHQLIRPVWENALIPKSVASPSLLSEIIVDWGRMFLPLYRQEMNEERFGFSLSRQRMSSWIGYVVRNYLQQVYLYLCGQLKKYSYQQCDETYWQVVLDERKAGAKSFIWVHRSGELLPGPAIVAYCYEKTRGADHLRNFYAGILQMIFLTCDAYSAYPCFAGETGGLMILTGCYMHCRRRFVEAVLILKLNDLTDDQIRTLPEVKAVALIAEIYIADNALKEMSADKRQKQRQEKVRLKVNAFFDFIRTIDLDDPLVSDKLRDAVRYALNQEENLRKFLDDGNIPLDNGASERSVRPVAQFRRNSLFSFTTGGAEVMVVIFTLIETAKANQADPYYYLKYLLEQMPQHLYDQEAEYMPDLMPWSQRYRCYEMKEKEDLVKAQAPPGNEKPRTPRKRDKVVQSA
jgi:Transposase IS66 family.